MIISHKHKFIFIKTEKTAGTSIEIALSQVCGPDDIITSISPEDEAYRKQLGYPSAQNHYLPWKYYSLKDFFRLVFRGKKKKFLNHISAAEILKYIPKETWDSYYKFCFERNPYDKFISWYYWRGKKYNSIDHFIAKSPKADKIRGIGLYTLDGKIAVDKIYKMEELDAALQDISEKLGLDEPIQMPSKKTKGGIRKDKRHYSEILTPEQAEWVRVRAAEEIQLLDYKF